MTLPNRLVSDEEDFMGRKRNEYPQWISKRETRWEARTARIWNSIAMVNVFGAALESGATGMHVRITDQH